MSWPCSSPYFIGDTTFAYDYSPGKAQNAQANSSGNTFGVGNSYPSTIEPELFTFLPHQSSYPSGHIRANRGADDHADGFSYFARGELLKNRSLYDGVSYLERIDRFEAQGEHVPQKHVDVLSDGVYLNTASQDSFIGVSLSPSVGPITFTRSRLSVQLDGPPSQSNTSSTPESPFQQHSSSLTLRESNDPNYNSRLLDQPSNLEQDAYQQSPQHHWRGPKTLPATLPGPAYDADVFDRVRRPESATKRSSRTSLRTYSSLKKDRSRSPEHDFAVVIVERESSGESTDYGEPKNDKGDFKQSSKHSIAAKAANIIRDWKIESNSEEQQRLDWEAYGKYELETDGHVFILQKLPPAAFKTKIVTCAHPYCSAPQKRSPPASYRLSLEPKENLKRAVVPTEPLYIAHFIERCVGNVEEGLRGKGECGVIWYCLTCVEGLWRGVGMLQGKPHVKRERRGGSRRQVKPLNPERLGLSGEPSSVESTHHPDLSSPSPLRKKAKLYLRGPWELTKAGITTAESGDVEDHGLGLATEQGSKKVGPSPSRLLPMQEKEPTEKALNTSNRPRGSLQTFPNEENIINTGQSQNNFNVRNPSTDIVNHISSRPSLSLDGTVDEMPPPKARSRKRVGRAMILQAGMRVGAMVTEKEMHKAALFESPRRQRPTSFRSPSTAPSVPFASIHLLVRSTKLPPGAKGNSSKRVAHTTSTRTESAQPTTSTLIPEPSELTTLHLSPLGTDSGYITEISADDSTNFRPLDKSLTRSSQTLQDRLRRQREVVLIVRALETKKAKAATSKKRKLLDDTTSDPIEPATIFRLQSVVGTRTSSIAPDSKGRILQRVEDAGLNSPRSPAGKGNRTRSRKQRVVDEDAPGTKSALIPVPVPEHWCICHRPGDEQDMLQCDGEYCLVGWFHLRCTGLAVMPDQDEPWYCRACLSSSTPSRAGPSHAPPPFDGPADYHSQPQPRNKTPLKRARAQSSASSPTSTFPAPSHSHQHPPPPAPASSKSQPALAPISHFIHGETRSHPSGHYALSSPQLFALRRWKAVINYERIFHVPANRMFMERNGLDYVYPDEGGGQGEGGEVVVDVLPDTDHDHDRDGDGDGDNAEANEVDVEGQGEGGGAMGATMGIMEIGGLVVEVTKKEVRGRELSEVLGIVDARVEAELVRLGWCDEGVNDVSRRKNGKVRLRLRVGERDRIGEDDSEISESDAHEGGETEKELNEKMGTGKVRLKLRVGNTAIEGESSEEDKMDDKEKEGGKVRLRLRVGRKDVEGAEKEGM